VLSGSVLSELDACWQRSRRICRAGRGDFRQEERLRRGRGYQGFTASPTPRGYELIRRGQQVLNRLALPCPTVAAIHGFALGGGLELALACRYAWRSPMSGCRSDCEVLLGIHPGFGGTVRSVRVAGVRPAMELMLSGKPVRAEKALRLGLIDRLVPRASCAARRARGCSRHRAAPAPWPERC